MKHLFVLLLSIFLASVSIGQETKTKQEKLTWQEVARATLNPMLEKKKIDQVMIGVIDQKGNKHYLAMGEKPEKLEKLDENTIFEIGSITKTMTSILLADAIQRMEMKLDDPVQQYLPTGMTVPTRDGKPVTLEQLATHTSGFPRMPQIQMEAIRQDGKLLADPYSRFDSDQLKKALETTKVKVEKKPRVDYSNFGTGLLGFALARKYGKDYSTLIDDRLFKPLEMKSSFITVPASEQKRFIDGHSPTGTVVPHWDFTDPAVGAGGVRSTAADMLRYLEAAMGKSNALQPAFNLALAPQYEMNPRMQIGLAWLMLDMQKSRVWWHNGGTGGFCSYCAFSKSPGVAVVILCNRGGTNRDVDNLGMKLMDTLLKEGK